MTRPPRLRTLGQWLILGSTVGVVSGSASALFLTLLDHATETREAHEGLVFALPVAGLFIGWFYERYGAPIRGGNNLVIDTLHTSLRQDGPALPLRMAPMVLFGTVLTHLFGGSAGREGTAVQMGASLADALAHRLGLGRELRRQMLIAGVAGGFGSVFGTPVAGALFGLELPTLGRIDSRAVAPALVAALVGDLTTRAWGVTHSAYTLAPTVALGPGLALRWLLFAGAVALVSAAFIELTHLIKRLGERLIPRLPLRLFVGGAALVGLWQLAGTSDYLGLGIPTILRAFSDPELPVHTFALKLLFTSLTVGVGFLGGEVTPLFFIGAALGSVLSPWIGVPTALGAGVGLAAVFGAASNTPVALSIMAVELLGAGALPHVALVSVAACFFKGNRSIYPAQRDEA